MSFAEQLVLDTQQFRTFDREVAAPGEPHRLATGGPIERLGDGSPPIDDDGFGIGVGDGKAADVETFQAATLDRCSVLVDSVPIDPTENEGGVPEIQVGQAFDQRFVERVALESGLERAPEIGFGDVT